jgi:hypothetical protein
MSQRLIVLFIFRRKSHYININCGFSPALGPARALKITGRHAFHGIQQHSNITKGVRTAYTASKVPKQKKASVETIRCDDHRICTISHSWEGESESHI